MKNFYIENSEYTDILEKQDEENFLKYVDFLMKYSREGNKVLDIGCGTGIALKLFTKKNRLVEVFGIDISKTSIKKCKEKGINCQVYNGERIPFPEGYFDIVGSYNTLEHVDDPDNFLKECLRVLKNDGFFFLACPNFLSITNNYHNHTRGVKQKIKNMFTINKKIISKEHHFSKMAIIIKKIFNSDDDACNVTNPLDLIKWSKENTLEIIYYSSQSVYKSGLINFLDKGFLKIFLGSSFFIFRQ